MALPDSFIDELISRCDIADVVGDYVQLTKKSGNNLFGLCPFHSEKTPSFSVSLDKQIYHCFGCGKGGGVISFIMEIEGLSFIDAVHFLAKRAGLEVPDDDTPEELKNRRGRMLELNREAARFFYQQLSTDKGSEGLKYIAKRGIDAKTAKKFGLGCAPNAWNELSDAMIKKGYTRQELLDAGLAKKGKNGGIYDTFRNRLMFPVIDVRGSVLGFSGRILDDGEPKYLNSPDTLVFNKSRNLFALNLAKKTKRDYLILAEGNVDVVSLHQAGFDCAVASLGTSLTPEQARLMTRYTKNVVIAYDSDGAGVKAAQRAIGILEKTGLGVKVLKMNGAKDPDEYIKKRGGDAFENLLDKSENHIDYRLLTAKSKYDLETDEGKIDFLKESTEILADIANSVEREVYTAKAAGCVGISADALKNEVQKTMRRRYAAQKKRAERAELRPSESAQPKDRAIRYANTASAIAEEGIIRLLMLDQTLAAETGKLTREDFTSEFLRKTYDIIIGRYQSGTQLSVAAMAAELSPGEMSQLTEIINKPENLQNRKQALMDYIDKIKTEKLKKSEDIMSVRDRLKDKKGYGG